MNTNKQKAAGISLILGCFLMIVTMVLHPVGGDFEHLVRIRLIGIVSHAIAILSVPLVAYGFWGFSTHVGGVLSKISFAYMLFGLIAVMLAAAVNGLILMDFVKSYEGAPEEVIESLKPFFRLIRDFNHAFDFIFIGAVCISTTLWSIAILKISSFPTVIGWFGLAITAMALTFLLLGFVFVDLQGFRIFIFGWVAWVIWMGITLFRIPNSSEN